MRYLNPCVDAKAMQIQLAIGCIYEKTHLFQGIELGENTSQEG